LLDYDIGCGLAVGRLWALVFSAAPAPAPPGQFSREGITPGVNVNDSRANRGFVRPIVWIQSQGGLREALTFFGRPGAPGNPMAEFCVTRTQARRFCPSERPSQQRLIIDHR
jgi:hypothetical protein